MAGKKDKFALTDKQELFVDAFTGECEFDMIRAYRTAGYAKSRNSYTAARALLNSEAVRRAIYNRMNESTFWINEGVIIDRLFAEGMTATNPSARINALVWVGKHIGMWKDKVDDGSSGVTYNIVNYSQSKETMKEVIEETPKIEEKKDKVALPEGVQVLDFSEPKRGK